MARAVRLETTFHHRSLLMWVRCVGVGSSISESGCRVATLKKWEEMACDPTKIYMSSSLVPVSWHFMRGLRTNIFGAAACTTINRDDIVANDTNGDGKLS